MLQNRIIPEVVPDRFIPIAESFQNRLHVRFHDGEMYNSNSSLRKVFKYFYSITKKYFVCSTLNCLNPTAPQGKSIISYSLR